MSGSKVSIVFGGAGTVGSGIAKALANAGRSQFIFYAAIFPEFRKSQVEMLSSQHVMWIEESFSSQL